MDPAGVPRALLVLPAANAKETGTDLIATCTVARRKPVVATVDVVPRESANVILVSRVRIAPLACLMGTTIFSPQETEDRSSAKSATRLAFGIPHVLNRAGAQAKACASATRTLALCIVSTARESISARSAARSATGRLPAQATAAAMVMGPAWIALATSLVPWHALSVLPAPLTIVRVYARTKAPATVTGDAWATECAHATQDGTENTASRVFLAILAQCVRKSAMHSRIAMVGASAPTRLPYARVIPALRAGRAMFARQAALEHNVGQSADGM